MAHWPAGPQFWRCAARPRAPGRRRGVPKTGAPTSVSCDWLPRGSKLNASAAAAGASNSGLR
eukprot:9574604-Lingulodinium_polyedra.AAC.1